MSTDIKSTFAPENTSIEIGPLTGYSDNPCMYLSINDDQGHALANFTRADFLAAVAKECGVRIVDATEPLADWELELMGRKTVPADAIVITPGSSEQQQIDTYNLLASHPFFDECFTYDACLSDAMVQKLDRMVDAIVIERGELPEVDVKGNWATVSSRESYVITDPAQHREFAAQHLAIAAYLDANPPQPPIDEAQVEALANALRAAGGTLNPDIRARSLYLAGVRVEATS